MFSGASVMKTGRGGKEDLHPKLHLLLLEKKSLHVVGHVNAYVIVRGEGRGFQSHTTVSVNHNFIGAGEAEGWGVGEFSSTFDSN